MCKEDFKEANQPTLNVGGFSARVERPFQLGSLLQGEILSPKSLHQKHKDLICPIRASIAGFLNIFFY